MSLTIEGKKFPSPQAVSAFRELSKTAKSLNDATDKLGKVIEMLDAALKGLNLGLQAWVKFEDWSDEEGTWLTEKVGYGKIGGKWGISISSETGNYSNPDGDTFRSWLFNEAPREMRMKAIAHLQDVIAELNRVGEKTVDEINKKTAQVDELALAVKLISLPVPSGLQIPSQTSGGGK